MRLKKKWLAMLAVVTTVLLLGACGSSSESKIIGSWKAVADDKVTGYLEIGEERLVNREESMTAEYILTETQDDNFLVEVVNPESGSNVFLFEGYFENKDKIIVVKTPDGAAENNELVRVDNIEEAKKLQEKEENELAKEREDTKAKTEESTAKENDLPNYVTKEDITKQNLDGLVEHVEFVEAVDGDTVVVKSENGKETVNLLLIDTPEPNAPDGGQEYASRATNYVTESQTGQTVLLERGQPSQDEDGNTVGFIWTNMGSGSIGMLNQLMVSLGYARVANIEANEVNAKYLDEFQEAENSAKQEKYKIWEYDGYVTDDGFNPDF
ncbi:thermonuclease family protein [Pontibacillus salicampi]|uniref:Thermonuclease family protein n=1 Tax=Pontibacillus salicampi TaxID=1449801 RepID=A0ABV6LLP1_9BACI